MIHSLSSRIADFFVVRNVAKCNICYSVTFLISLLILRLLIYYDVCVDSLMMALVGFVVIVYYAPLENHNKKLCQKQKDTYECISMAMYIIAIFIARASVNSASFFAAYQPKEPDSLKKKDK